jgi:integrase
MAGKTGMHRLTALQVQRAKGDLNDGGGLWLRFPRKRKGEPAWTFRYTGLKGRRETGLGVVERGSAALAGKSLTTARVEAEKARKLLLDGIDPIEHDKAQREAARRESDAKKAAATAEHMTLRRFARKYHEEHIEPVKSRKHAQQWINTIEQHVLPALLDAPIGDIQPLQLLDALVPVCRRVPPTGRRVFQRLGVLFDAAVLEGLRLGNPATPIKRELFKRAGPYEGGHHAAMPYALLPEFVKKLRAIEGTSARCMEFAILAPGRTIEALHAEWREIDVQARTWNLPGERMKNGKPHTVYLTDRGLAILEGQRGQSERFVFPTTWRYGEGDAPMSNMAMLMQLRRMTGVLKGKSKYTVHGFRSTFSDWAYEHSGMRGEVIEACMAHVEANKTKSAYLRTGFETDRRKLLRLWADYVESGALPTNVVPLPLARVA